MFTAAIIGVSGFGDVHYNDLKKGVEQGRVKILGATVINQNEEEEKCQWLTANGVKLYTNWQEMLDELSGKIDLCFIPTGIAMHAPMSIAAMKVGANVFVEKPVTATIQEVKQLEAVCEETGKFVAVGFQNIYLPDTHQLKKFLLSGRLGKLKALKARGFWSRNNLYYGRNNWAGCLKVNDAWVLDSPFNNALAHFLNLICFLAGNEFESSAELREITSELYHANKIESADTACIRAVTSDDVDILFYVTHACTQQTSVHIEIEGENGKVIFDFGESDIEIRLDDGTVEHIPVTPYSEYRGHIMKALEQRLSDPEAFVCNLQIAGTHILCVNGAHESCPVIHSIPSEFKETVVDGDSVVINVHNICNILTSAFDKGKLPSEIGIKWAVPGKPFDLIGYSEFNGGAE